MSDSKLTKKDVLNFVLLGKKIVTRGAGTVLEVAKSKIAELTDSEEALQRRVSAQVKALVDSGFTQEEARRAVSDRTNSRLEKVFEKLSESAGGNATGR